MMTAPLRYSTHAIDTMLLVAYVALGSFTSKRGETAAASFYCWIAALGVYPLIASVWRARSRLGVPASATGTS